LTKVLPNEPTVVYRNKLLRVILVDNMFRHHIVKPTWRLFWRGRFCRGCTSLLLPRVPQTVVTTLFKISFIPRTPNYYLSHADTQTRHITHGHADSSQQEVRGSSKGKGRWGQGVTKIRGMPPL